MDSSDSVMQQKVMQAAKPYNRFLLYFYDYYVYRCVAPIFFRCPQQTLIDFYTSHISTNHLEIGVGTGYLLTKCFEANKLETLSLLDLNATCLNMTEQKLSALSPNKYHANILEPFPINDKRFTSVGLNFVLHCVPGGFKDKGIAFEHIAASMDPGGTLFGSTAIYYPGQSNVARIVMDIYNRKGIFNNREDTIDDLVTALSQQYTDIEVTQIGNILFFHATKK